MQEILFGYKLNPTTWAYVSALMMIGVYFKFRRFWSVRNLDLMALIAFSPGLLLIYFGQYLVTEEPDRFQDGNLLIQNGYVWLFVISGFFLVRLLLVDPVMVRRPLLEPNLSASGLTFTGIALLVFLMANVITSPKERLEYELAEHPTEASRSPGLPWFQAFSDYSNRAMIASGRQPEGRHRAAEPKGQAAVKESAPAPADAHREALMYAAVRLTAIVAHLAVVAGMLWIGYRHFGNIHTGAAAATLYLLSVYTSQLTSQVDHVVPAALLVWTAAAYRRPLVAGALLGIAAGLIYYPLFLLPLWCSFYWRRGLLRFAFGVLLALGVLVALVALKSPNSNDFWEQVRMLFGWRNPFVDLKFAGFWNYFEPAFRIPVLALFVAGSLGLAIWPAHKNFGTLLACSAAVMLGTQFWHADQGGLYMAWYLPLLILTIFRPNLEDRIALSAVRPAWGRRRAKG